MAANVLRKSFRDNTEPFRHAVCVGRNDIKSQNNKAFLDVGCIIFISLKAHINGLKPILWLSARFSS